jgi:hypothetical protein
MKKLIVTISCLAMLSACGSNEPKKADGSVVNNPASAATETVNADEAPAFNFEENIHDFGKLVDGEVVTYKFKFTNTGKTPLLISSATASCGCTVPSYPKEPIAPGAEGSIDVQFNSSGKVGVFNKDVTIVANTIPNQTILAIKGEVEAKK